MVHAEGADLAEGEECATGWLLTTEISITPRRNAFAQPHQVEFANVN